MVKIKVLIADDSAFMRRIINDIISSQSDMEIVGYARDGQDAVNKALLLKPDLITMDIEMPKKNGLEATKEILYRHKCKVIMVSSHTSTGSEITMEALSSGAYHFIQKPNISQGVNMDTIGRELIDLIRSAFQNDSNSYDGNSKPYNSLSCNNACPLGLQPKCLLLGASTGGPKVLFNIIKGIPNTIKVPVFVVQHMPSLFTKAFADRINKSSSLQVYEAEDGMKPEGGKVYIAPGGYHMVLEYGLIRLNESPTVHGVRPSVDNLFISAANYYEAPMVACIFTGMGRDGAEGIKAVKRYGGYVLAQDQATSTVFGMPKAAIDTGCVDKVLSDIQIGEELKHIFS